jgi:His/Glu/Gln/Arg/opine family amino acid ABC transporter permease subunit
VSFHWDIFWGALASAAFLKGALVSLALTVAAHALAILLATPLALISNRNRGAAAFAVRLYVWLFRGIPTLLQLLFIWNALPQFIPALQGPWFTPFLAALLALTLNEAAYQTEINRAALRSVDPGQQAAGLALGLTARQVFFHVTAPQALRVAIPPTANEFINLLKVTSLASVISLRELLTVTNQAVASSFRFVEYYSAALVYYLVIVGALTYLQSRLERRLAWSTRGSREASVHEPLAVVALPGPLSHRS